VTFQTDHVISNPLVQSCGCSSPFQRQERVVRLDDHVTLVLFPIRKNRVCLHELLREVIIQPARPKVHVTAPPTRKRRRCADAPHITPRRRTISWHHRSIQEGSSQVGERGAPMHGANSGRSLQKPPRRVARNLTRPLRVRERAHRVPAAHLSRR
jgi:hypothetical protein